MTESVRAAVFHGADQPLKIESFSRPILIKGEALVRVECCTLCGSDLHTMAGKRNEPVPSILGHEILGRIIDMGTTPLRDVQGEPLRHGDRVTWSTAISCAHCDRCQNGLPQKCRTVAKYGHLQAYGRLALSGGLAEEVVLQRGSAVVRVPDDLSTELLTPVNCATATVAAALRSAGSLRQQRVLILGAGMLGLTAAAFVTQQQPASLTVCDPDSSRLKRATEFGGPTPLKWQNDLARLQADCEKTVGTSRFDVVFEFSGAPSAVEFGCHVADVNGRVVLVGSVMKSPAVKIDPEQVVRRWLTIRGVHNYTSQDLASAVGFLKEHHQTYPFASLVEAQFQLDDINSAVTLAQQQHLIRVAIHP